MLTGKFFTIVSQQRPDAQSVHTVIDWNAAHPVFAGHFPDQPVVPGVCMMQTIQELLSAAVGKELLVEKASNMKFLNMIDPRHTPQVTIELSWTPDDAAFKANAIIKHDTTTFLKFQGRFK